MKTESPLPFYLRIVIVSVCVALLGLGPSPHAAAKFLVKASQAISDGDLLHSASNLASAAQYFAWRDDLNITAAQLAYQAGDPQSAIQYLERPGTDSHLRTQDLILLGDAYQQSGNSSMAEAIWKRVLELADSIPACQRLTDLYLQHKDYSSAASYMQKQLSLQPSNVKLYYQIGELLALIDPPRALSYLAQAAQLDEANASHATALHDKIRTASLFDEPAYTSVVVGRQLGDWGEWNQAAIAFQQAISLRPAYADAWAFLGEAKQQITLQETGHNSDVGQSELEHAIQLDASSVLANTLMGIYWERQGDYSQANQYMQTAISLSPKDPYLFSELGNILSKAGDLPAAQAAYEAAIKLTPQDPIFYRQLAQYAMDNQIQIHQLALPAARQAIMLDPHDAISLDVMAQVMLMLLDYPSAVRFSTSAVQSDPTYAPAYLHLGTAYLYQGKADQAQKWLEQAETLNPGSWVADQATRMLDYYFPKTAGK